MDIGDKVRDLAGATAVVKGAYGGFRIEVTDEAGFPFAAVFHCLADLPQDVWMRRENGMLVILSKPPSI